MAKVQERIPKATLETLARTFVREASAYGFKEIDFVRFVNLLLDASIQSAPTLAGCQRTADEDGCRTASIRQLSSLQLPLCGEQIKIRRFVPAQDMSLLRRWLSDKHGRYFLLSCSTARTMDLNELINNPSNIVAIVTDMDETAIGAVAFLNYDRIQKKTELRKLIGEASMRGKGLAKEATRLWIQYGLVTLGLEKIYLNTLDTNIRNIKLNEDLGFKVEGILRNDVFFDNKRHDVLRMALLYEKELPLNAAPGPY